LVFNRLSECSLVTKLQQIRQSHPTAAIAAENQSEVGLSTRARPGTTPWHPAASTFNAAFIKIYSDIITAL
jgi:hypothetical protein